MFPERTEKSGDPAAKYVNSPEGPLYSKSRVLYAFDKAKGAIRRTDSCVIVEGQMDVVLSHQAGVTQTVAASGTALTEEQLELIGRLTKNIILAFDADSAGLSAARRSIGLALSLGFDVRVAHLPQGKDPGDIAASAPEQWVSIVGTAPHVIDFHLATLGEIHTDPRAFRLAVEKIALPHVAALKSAIERAHFVGVVSKKMGIPEEAVWDALKAVDTTHEASRAKNQTIAAPGAKENSLRTRIEERILGIMLWQEGKDTAAIPPAALEARYLEATGEPLRKKLELLSKNDTNRLVFEAELSFGNSEKLREAAEELFLHLKREIIERRLVSAMDEMRRAEESGDLEAARRHLESCSALSREKNDLMILKPSLFNN